MKNNQIHAIITSLDSIIEKIQSIPNKDSELLNYVIMDLNRIKSQILFTEKCNCAENNCCQT